MKLDILRTMHEALKRGPKVDLADKPADTTFTFNQPKSKGSLASQQPKAEPKQQASSSRKTASHNQTWNKMGNISLNPKAAEMLGNMDTTDLDMDNEISDEEAMKNAGIHATPGKPEPKTPEMLPAVISKAMVKMGTDLANIEPEWHMVKHLPGYLQQGIRALGRQVFKPFTSTPIEDIQVLANLEKMGGGPNNDAEIDSVVNFVRKNGEKNTDAELKFQKVLPGYEADVSIYDCEGYTFMLVKDFAGKYIYSWPESDSKTLNGKADRMLGRNRPALESFYMILEGKEEFIATQMGEKIMATARKDRSARQFKTPLEIVQKIAEGDPTPNKACLQWLVRMYVKGQYLLEDLYRTTEDIKLFLVNKRNIANKDINSYPSIQDLAKVLTDVKQAPVISTDWEQKYSHKDVQMLVNKPNIKIMHLTSDEAARIFGQVTAWCTTNGAFASYSDDLIAVVAYDATGKTALVPLSDVHTEADLKKVNPDNWRRFQLHYSSGQMMNAADHPIHKNEIDFLSSFPEWGEFLNNLINKHYTFLDEK